MRRLQINNDFTTLSNKNQALIYSSLLSFVSIYYNYNKNLSTLFYHDILKEMKAHRLDVYVIDQKTIERRPDGSIVVDAYINRTGIQLYRLSDGSFKRELRRPEEVFKQETLDSFKLIPVTNEHPPEMVTIDNKDIYQVGTSGENVEIVDNKFTKLKLMINDKKTISDIESQRKLEVSCGYLADIEEIPGIDPEFGQYDSSQKGIIGNHVAVVKKGRGGSKVRIRTDCIDGAIMVLDNEKDGGNTMKIKILIDGKEQEVEVTDESGKLIQSYIDSMKSEKEKMNEDLCGTKKKADELQAKIDNAGKTDSELQAKIDVLNATNKELKEKVDSIPSLIVSGAKERASLIADAKKSLKDELISKLDTMSNTEIKRSIIKVRLPKIDNLESKNDSEINLMFDMASAIVNDSFSTLGSNINSARQDAVLDAATDKSTEAASSYKKDITDAWKTKK